MGQVQIAGDGPGSIIIVAPVSINLPMVGTLLRSLDFVSA
jgi:hypothetical protein